MVKSLYCLAAVAAAQLVVPARAADCSKLVSYGSVPLTQIEHNASEFIPVEIAGTKKLMMVDTGANFTTMTGTTADELHLGSYGSALGLYDVTGAYSAHAVSAPLKVGNVQFPRAEFILAPGNLKSYGDPRVAGLLGNNMFRGYDISIDFGSHKLDIFSQGHCEGQVVYWPERPLAVVPFKVMGVAEVVLQVKLDGQEITAALDTGAGNSTLDKSLAERTFGVVMGSADTPAAGDLNGKNGLTMWTHRFKTLSLAGLEVLNPEVDIIPDKVSAQINTWSTGSMLDKKYYSVDMPTMLLGMNILRHLHIYIAYKEKKLYITPASQPASAPATAAPATPAPSSVHG